MTTEIDLLPLPEGEASSFGNYKVHDNEAMIEYARANVARNTALLRAEIAGQYLRKGSQVYIEGSLRTRKWQDQSGQDRYSTEIRADEMKMLGKREGGEQSAPPLSSAKRLRRSRSSRRAGSVTSTTTSRSSMPRPRHTWTEADDAMLRDGYGRRPTREIAAEIGVSETAVRQRAKKLGIRFECEWPPERIEQLRALYPTHTAAECAQIMGATIEGIHYAASRHGLSKSREWIAERRRQNMQRPDHPAHRSRFQKGLIPHNKGKPHPTRGRAAETQFKPGMRPHTWNPIGHERESKEGYLQRKVSDTGVTRRDYVGIHHLVWRMHGMQIPAGHALVFRDGDKRNFDINNLELVARAELMRRNSVHRHGKEIASAYQLIGAIKRQINKQTKEQRA